jgi:hypothetical protein
MAFDLTEPDTLTGGSLTSKFGLIRENIRAMVQGDAGVFSKKWITANVASLVMERASQTAKGYLQSNGDGTNSDVYLSTNAIWTGSWNRDSTSRVAWNVTLSAQTDALLIRRAAAAANPITWTNLLQIDSSGKVGIGVAPTVALDVVGSAKLSSASTSGTQLQVKNTDTGGRDWWIISNGSASGGGAGLLHFWDNTATATRLTIDANGSLSIGGVGSFGSGQKVIWIANATTDPSTNPTGGGVLYCSGGALKYRGTSGTVTTLGAA